MAKCLVRTHFEEIEPAILFNACLKQQVIRHWVSEIEIGAW